MKCLLNKLNELLAAICLMTFAGGQVLAGGLVELDFDKNNFPDPAVIDNSYWPLIPGTVFTYFAETEDGCEWNVVDVTYDDTTYIAEVKVVVVLDLEWLDESDGCAEGDYDPADYDPFDPFNEANFPPGDLTEFTFDWYAQDDAPDGGGYIWYLGEATLSFDFEPGECEGTIVPTPFGDGCPDGSFEVGVDDAEAGIVMLADPSKGDFYQQEFYEDNAEDWGKVLNFIPVDDFEDDCLKTKEWTPLEPGAVEHKYYCPEDGLVLIEEVSGGPKVWVELIDVTEYDPE